MVHVQFRLDRHRRNVLLALAEHEQRSVSEVMRDAVDLLIERCGAPKHPATPRSEVESAWDRPLPLDEIDQIA